MQHPRLLDFFVESTAKLEATIRDSSALVVVDVDSQSIRIQRPMGPEGGRLLEERIQAESGKRAVLAAGLCAADADRVRNLCPRAGKPIEQQVEFSDIGAFDLDLKGSSYKSLRSSLHHAEREQIAVEAYDPAVHLAASLKIFEEWNSMKSRVGTFWIPKILAGQIADYARLGLLALVAVRRKKILGITIAFVAGSYGYMLLALTLSEHGRAQELVDYELIRRLKEKGVRKLDWGIADSGPISAYKKKYGNIVREPITTFWIPAGR